VSGRIDVHQHLIPNLYRRRLDERGMLALGWPAPEWSPDSAIAMMDRRGISTGILSIGAPGVHFGDDAEARELARQINDQHAELVARQPERFGQLAVLPLPDVDAAVAEARYALDELHADGVALLSNAGGRYLGDARFEPLWAELDARHAVVLVHPTAPPTLSVQPGPPGSQLDFPFETTLSAVDMAANQVPSRHPGMRVIFSRFDPLLARRACAARVLPPDVTEERIMSALRGCYFDTALSSSSAQLGSLAAFARHGRVLYGSDSPHVADRWGRQFDRGLDEAITADRHRLAGINRDNALELFPRLRHISTNSRP
jgi:predicted TIM-barrel fold metal-dependent hydrolase